MNESQPCWPLNQEENEFKFNLEIFLDIFLQRNELNNKVVRILSLLLAQLLHPSKNLDGSKIDES